MKTYIHVLTESNQDIKSSEASCADTHGFDPSVVGFLPRDEKNECMSLDAWRVCACKYVSVCVDLRITLGLESYMAVFVPKRCKEWMDVLGCSRYVCACVHTRLNKPFSECYVHVYINTDMHACIHRYNSPQRKSYHSRTAPPAKCTKRENQWKIK